MAPAQHPGSARLGAAAAVGWPRVRTWQRAGRGGGTSGGSGRPGNRKRGLAAERSRGSSAGRVEQGAAG
ncbi:unnamed protein product [Caretta caretta]